MADSESSKWGRVFMGSKISELSEVEGVRSRAWTEKDEAEYLDRVRQKATDKAREILSAAETEAERVRQQARDEGYAEGARQADIELAEFRDSMGSTVSAVLEAVKSEASAVYRAWREDLAALLRLSVEKALGLTLNGERAKILTALYEQAVKSLESSRRITVRVNPEDEAVLADIIAMGQAAKPGLESWQVKSDPGMAPGGVIVESESSLADNSIESRTAALEEVLGQLNIP